jgi:hypothetical protein
MLQGVPSEQRQRKEKKKKDKLSVFGDISASLNGRSTAAAAAAAAGGGRYGAGVHQGSQVGAQLPAHQWPPWC